MIHKIATGIFPSDFTDGQSVGDFRIYSSARCGGPYQISGTALQLLMNCTTSDRMLLCEQIWRMRPTPSDMLVILNSEHIRKVRDISPPSIPERLVRALRILVKSFPKLGQTCTLVEEADIYLTFLGASFSIDSEEATAILQELHKRGLIILNGQSYGEVAEFTITADGHIEGSQTHVSADYAQAFVAMWFSPEMDTAYQMGIDPAVRDCGYIPFRVDRKEHNNKIDDEIIAAIRSSRFLIADFTSEPDKPRGGVYYEAGFAQGLGLPVIWMCRADLIDKVHFDTRQYNHITWTNEGDLREKLRNRIIATIGRGPNI